jgi:predicted metal-binding membrane protein
MNATVGRLLQRDRFIVGVALVAVATLGWTYTLGLDLGRLPSLMAMPQRHGWTGGDVALTMLMWLVMMLAMMTPAAAPVLLLVAAVERRRAQPHAAARVALAFAGYFTVWGAACVAATLMQWGLHDAGFLDGPMGRLLPGIAGATLIAVGLYELSPLKAACLRLCRSPIDTIAAFWRPVASGSFRVGLHHGIYCLGCCWGLMLILFVAGIMNLLWIALLTALVLVEKLLPWGQMVGRISGIGFMGWGVLLLVAA